jgi:hypothetical protein
MLAAGWVYSIARPSACLHFLLVNVEVPRGEFQHLPTR